MPNRAESQDAVGGRQTAAGSRRRLVLTAYRLPPTAYRLQILPQKADDLPGVEVDPRALAAGVVAAGEPGDVDGDARRAHARDHLVREVGREGQVVARGDEAHGAAAQRGEP